MAFSFLIERQSSFGVKPRNQFVVRVIDIDLCVHGSRVFLNIDRKARDGAGISPAKCGHTYLSGIADPDIADIGLRNGNHKTEPVVL